MINVIKATIKEKEEVYEWVLKSITEEEKRYLNANLNMFLKPVIKADKETIYETLEKQKYKNRYGYYLAYDKDEIVGILNFVHILRENRNYLRIIHFYASKNKRKTYEALLKTLEDYAEKEEVAIMKMRSIFPQENILKECLEEKDFILRRVSFTDEDLKVEKKFHSFGYKISFATKKEASEIQNYYDKLALHKKEFHTLDIKEYMKSKSSRILVARKNKKIVGLLLGSIASPHYTVAYLDICVGTKEEIEHDLLNEFKRVCLNEESDDILVETTNRDFQNFILKENFKESRRNYWRILKEF